jgi:hypothetical protein
VVVWLALERRKNHLRGATFFARAVSASVVLTREAPAALRYTIDDAFMLFTP